MSEINSGRLLDCLRSLVQSARRNTHLDRPWRASVGALASPLRGAGSAPAPFRMAHRRKPHDLDQSRSLGSGQNIVAGVARIIFSGRPLCAAIVAARAASIAGRHAALIDREAVTLPLDHAFGFELADVGTAAIEMQRQCRRDDGRGLSDRGREAGLATDERSMVTVSAIVFHSCCVAIGYSDCSVSVNAVSAAAPCASAFGGIAHPDRACAGSTRSGRTQSGH